MQPRINHSHHRDHLGIGVDVGISFDTCFMVLFMHYILLVFNEKSHSSSFELQKKNDYNEIIPMDYDACIVHS